MNQIDMSIVEAVQNIRMPWLDKIMVFITTSNDLMIIWIGLALFLLYQTTQLNQLKYIIPAIIITMIINNYVIKPLVARPRPFVENPDIINLVSEQSFSFPSGHSSSSFLAATILSYYFPQYRVGFFLLATLIAFSRIYVGVHFPSDVIGGALLGISAGIITCLFIKKRTT